MDIDWKLGHALKEITPDGVLIENVDTHEEVEVSTDAVVLSLGYKSDQSLVSGLKDKAIRDILPAPLEPFALPVVTFSACHIQEPTFSDNYYEAILGVYATYKGQLGLYPISLLLGGPGAEMATQLGRDNSAIPKKLDAEIMIRRDENHVTVNLARRGAEIANVKMRLGEYNHPLTHMLYQSPSAGAQTAGNGYYFHFDCQPDQDGKFTFTNGCLIRNTCVYDYKSWEPGFVEKLELKSSIDDPWGCLPINTIVGGGYAHNKLSIKGLEYLEDVNPADFLAKVMPAWYDQTAFMKPKMR